MILDRPIILEAAPGYEGPLLILVQKGMGTAVLVDQYGPNPCIKCIARENAACLELEQKDGEDSIWAVGSDARFRQHIASLAAVIAGHSHRYIAHDPNGQEEGKVGDVFWNASVGAPLCWKCDGGTAWTPFPK